MTLRLNGSSSGHTEIKAPAAAGSNTITLPTSNGSADQFLMNSGTAGELEFAALASSDMPTGSILQVVEMTTSTQTSSTTNSYADTSITLNITPQFSTSKVLVLVTASGLTKRDQNTSGALQLLRGSTVLSSIDGAFAYNNSTQHNAVGSAALNYLDSPATTSATTYKVQVKNNQATGSVRVNWDGGSTSSMVLLEVAA